MSPTWLFAQFFGLISLVILAISFHKKKKSDLLALQTVSNLSSGIQYFLLGALSGGFIHLICVARNFVFRKYKKKIPPLAVYLTLLSILVVTALSFDGLTSLLPMFSISLYTYALAFGDLRKIRIIDIVACFIAIIYNLLVGAYVGIIVSVVEIISAGTALLRFDLTKSSKRARIRK
ncbi:YgjV family protein [Candidatus Saccharibacteria bacterium]|nr:YgjV family protein [Candidatus Saccharibacteria bacterium]